VITLNISKADSGISFFNAEQRKERSASSKAELKVKHILFNGYLNQFKCIGCQLFI
jgi:hypothetical protein